MDKQCSTSTGQCSEVNDNSQEFCDQEIPEICSLKESNSDYMCNLCNKFFAKEKYLKKHIKIHVVNKPHICNICSKSFNDKGNLNRHLLIHSGEKHVCNFCNKSFTQIGSLKAHLLTHSGERPHVCNICNKSFNRKGSLKTHSLIHIGERPHVCNTCNKSFTQTGSLKAHLLIHSREKPHECHICKKSFTQKGHLKDHLLTHGGEKLHVCNICSMTFGTKSNLNRHLLIHSRKRDMQNSSIDRGEELPSTSEKNQTVNSDSHLAETSENSHENKHPGKFLVKEEIVYIIEEEDDIRGEEYKDLDIDETQVKSDVDLHEMSCDVKEENITTK